MAGEDKPGRWSNSQRLGRGFGTPRAMDTHVLDCLVTASHKAIARRAAREGDIPAGADTGASTQHRVLGGSWLWGRELLLPEFCVCLGAVSSQYVPRRDFLILTEFPWLVPSSWCCLGMKVSTHAARRAGRSSSPKHTAVSGLVTIRALTGA